MSDLNKRVISGAAMALIAIATLIFFDGLPFKIFYAVVAIIAACELIVGYRKLDYTSTEIVMHVVTEFIILIAGAIIIATQFSRNAIITALVIAFANDIGAYFIGKFMHGKYSKSRPFPDVSPNKSWEGIVGGALFGMLGGVICYHQQLMPSSNYVFFVILTLTGWMVAVFGDWYESKTKRLLNIKDSGDTLRDNPVMQVAEGITEGHGGFMDRIDSLSTVAIYVFLLTLIL